MTHSENSHIYASLPLLEKYRTWAEIRTDALCHNYRLLRDRVHAENPDAVPISVIKADAYAHGAHPIVRVLLDEGCRFFAVSSIEEAIDVRNACRALLGQADDASILILGFTFPTLARLLAEYDVITAAPSKEYLCALSAEAQQAGVRVKVHFALDTGMNRIGFPAHSEEETKETVDAIAGAMDLPGLLPLGMFSHFARADEQDSDVPDGLTEIQVHRFQAVERALDARGVRLPLCHLCNSAGALRFPALSGGAVRLGLCLYGYPPSDCFSLPLVPVMALKTTVSHIHSLLPGETVSYGGTYQSDTPRTLATLPVGYADGFLRDYCGASVTISTAAGKIRVPVVGRICMDQCMVDITGYDVSIGDEVTLFGDSQKELRELARRAGTIPYESLCLITARVPRIYL